MQNEPAGGAVGALGGDSARTVLDAFFEIAEKWGLTTDEQIILLGKPARSTFFKWKKEGSALSVDTTERLSHIVSIWKALQIVLPDERQADDWIKRTNRYFANQKPASQTPLERMLLGQVADIYVVRQYLDAERGG